MYRKERKNEHQMKEKRQRCTSLYSLYQKKQQQQYHHQTIQQQKQHNTTIQSSTTTTTTEITGTRSQTVKLRAERRKQLQHPPTHSRRNPQRPAATPPCTWWGLLSHINQQAINSHSCLATPRLRRRLMPSQGKTKITVTPCNLLTP